MNEGQPASSAKGDARSGSYRWAICALLFFATTINYVDRSVLGLLAPVLQKE
ncbi:MFS transporter, partial [bacterium]